MTTSKFRAIRVQHLADPAFRAEVAREKAVMMQLDMAAVRLATGMTQEEVAAEMGKSQENISRIEHQRDVRVSTLARFVEAQGGELEINAVFAGKRVSLMRTVAPVATPSPRSQVRQEHIRSSTSSKPRLNGPGAAPAPPRE